MADTTLTQAESERGHHAIAHPIPLRTLLVVWMALMALTVLTVAVTYVDLGGLNLWIALAIAVLKGSLVGLFFMHLWYDRGFNGLIFVTALVFVAIFIGPTLMDTGAYQVDYQPPPGVQVK